jgi:hypothetical protein
MNQITSRKSINLHPAKLFVASAKKGRSGAAFLKLKPHREEIGQTVYAWYGLMEEEIRVVSMHLISNQGIFHDNSKA